jgi:hypothetical protein
LENVKTLQRIAFVTDGFALGSPAQQLLDRFLLGYPRDGEFHRPPGIEVRLYCANKEASTAFEQRAKEHGLVQAREMSPALAGADGIVVVAQGGGGQVNDELIGQVLAEAAPGTGCFVYGLLGSSLARAKQHAAQAQAHDLALLTGSALAVTWHLPEITWPADTALTQALAVVQGAAPEAELDAVDALLPFLDRRRGGETGLRSVQRLSDEELWKAGDAGLWSWDLLAAALSRSDSPQGNALIDGRTENLVRLGLVQKLVRKPRGWLLEHRDGLRTAVLVLNGVVGDYNVALQTGDGSILSTQIYRAPKPARHEFSRLAAVVEDYFTAGTPPWQAGRSLLTAELAEAFGKVAHSD